ncbi:MAG TPA: DoxX family protein [Sphingobacteriaceae bacterium]
MKQLFSVDANSKLTDIALLVARVTIAILMLVHGLPKLQMLFSGEPVQFPGVFGTTPEVSLALAVFAEVLCSVFLLAGLGTRIAAVPLIITMLVAVFMIHSADPFGKKELGIHYLATYVILLVAGSGRYSVDYVLQKR